MLAAAQAVVQKRLLTLQSRERELQMQVRTINRQFVHAEANKDVSWIIHVVTTIQKCALSLQGASVRDDTLSVLETKLLDVSSELVSTFCGPVAVNDLDHHHPAETSQRRDSGTYNLALNILSILGCMI